MKRIGLVVLAACGSSSSKTPDAPTKVIDAQPDAHLAPTPDAFLADAAEPIAGHFHYVVSKVQWPTTANEARADGLDLNNDGAVDNQIGMMMASLKSQGGFDPQAPTDQAIARGATITLADLGADDLTAAGSASFTLYQGSDASPPPCNGSADSTCGHHLHGTATFTAAATPRDTPITGSITGGVLSAGPGHLTMTLTIFGPSVQPLTLLAARTKLMATKDGVMTGIIAGAISTTDRDSKIYPAMAMSFTATVARDCTALTSPPACGCTSNSTGATLLSIFDANKDCSITTQELQTNSLIMSLFQPDVTVENQQAISVGFAVQAVDATFTP